MHMQGGGRPSGSGWEVGRVPDNHLTIYSPGLLLLLPPAAEDVFAFLAFGVRSPEACITSLRFLSASAIAAFLASNLPLCISLAVVTRLGGSLARSASSLSAFWPLRSPVHMLYSLVFCLHVTLVVGK